MTVDVKNNFDLFFQSMAEENMKTTTTGFFGESTNPLSTGMYSLLLPVTEDEIKQVNSQNVVSK